MKNKLWVTSITLILIFSFFSRTNFRKTPWSKHKHSHDHKEEEGLCQEVTTEGAKVVLINLDDEQQLHSIKQDGGIFLESGDMIVIS
jgi:hypothetical protein